MNKAVVSFYYQGHGILIFYTFFFLQFCTIPSCEGVTIFEANRRRGMQKDSSLPASSFFFHENRTKTAVYETTGEA